MERLYLDPASEISHCAMSSMLQVDGSDNGQ